MLNNLQKLAQLGQSPWYDNMERGLIENGELGKIFAQGILGVTTNPSIFEKAINNSISYDKDIRSLKKAGKTPLEIYDELTLRDVALAADLLLKTYEKTLGADGYVSLEVLPEYAHNAQKTIENARRLFSILKRKNIMIKIPATKEGCIAIQELISEGININATLIFSLSEYTAVANAYINGVNDGIKKGKDLSKVHSVASVFVSRVDSKVDSELQKILLNEKDADKKNVIKNLLGKTAVANIKIIYARYKELFSNKKMNFQRVLWASTSTKNPEYSDIKYVQELIAQNSVNTLPHETVIAFLDHGDPKITIEDNIKEAREDLKQLEKFGIDIEKVCGQIQLDGIKAFQDAFNKLIKSIENKQ